MKIDLDRVSERLALPEGWRAEVYDDWPEVHRAHLEVVAPGNMGAGYVVWSLTGDGVITAKALPLSASRQVLDAVVAQLREAAVDAQDENDHRQRRGRGHARGAESHGMDPMSTTLSVSCWLVFDSDGHTLAWQTPPGTKADALAAARQELLDCDDGTEDAHAYVGDAIAGMRAVEVQLRGDDLEALARGLVGITSAAGTPAVAKCRLDLVDWLMVPDSDCPHCGGRSIEYVGGEEIPCRYCLAPRARVTELDSRKRLAAALRALCMARGDESKAEGDAIWVEADAALQAYDAEGPDDA